MRPIALLAPTLGAALLLPSCATSGHAGREPFELPYRETVSLPEEGVSIRFDELLEDSRCPIGVNCVWEGDAAISLTVIDGDSELVIVLHTNGREGMPKEATVSGRTIRLTRLDPYPEEGVSRSAEHYVATLEVL